MPSATFLATPRRELPLDRTLLMGIVNVTPDSFSDGGCFSDTDTAIAHGRQLVSDGADIIDVGGQSTRPGSTRLGPADELKRILRVITRLVSSIDVPVSVDTYHSEVARGALEAGAEIVNDVSGLRADPNMVKIVAKARVPVVIMHSIWPPETMQDSPTYVDVVEDVIGFLDAQSRLAMAHGVSREQIVVDPGIGFGKTLQHNLELLRAIPQLTSLGFPVLIGPSRKRFLGDLTGRPVTEREAGTHAACALAAASGANMIRVHDVAGARDAVRVADAWVWQV